MIAFFASVVISASSSLMCVSVSVCCVFPSSGVVDIRLQRVGGSDNVLNTISNSLDSIS